MPPQESLFLDDEADPPASSSEGSSAGSSESEDEGSSAGSDDSWIDEDEDEPDQAQRVDRRVVLYARVSTAEQKRKGLSLPAQIERMGAYCKAIGVEVVGVLQEECSSAVEWVHRPAGAAAKNMLARGEANCLCVLRLDRLVRSAGQAANTLETFKRKGWEFLMVDPAIDTSTPVGKMLVTILGAVADLERSYIRQRTKEALKHRRQAQRLPTGRVRFGERLECRNCGPNFRPDPSMESRCLNCFGTIRLVKYNDELATMGLVWEAHERGASIRDTCRDLEVHGRKTKRGHVNWHPGTVGRMLAKLKKSTALRDRCIDALHRARLNA